MKEQNNSYKKNLLKRIQTKIVTFITDNKVSIKNNSLTSINILASESNQLTVSYEKSKLKIEDIILILSKQNIKILDIATDDANIEDVYLGLTKS